MSWLLVVNPFASGVDEPRLESVTAALPAGIEVVLTRGPGHATEIARERENGVEAIVVFAGDGTYNEVLNGVTGGVPLGFVPGGGTSVLPRALGLPRDPTAAAAAIARGHERRIGLGRVNGRRFGFNAGLGVDAELVRAVDRRGRSSDGRRPGDSAFVRATLGLLVERRARFEPSLEIEGLGRGAFALVANCNPYTYLRGTGLAVAPQASFETGLDVVAPIRVGAAELPSIALALARGRAPDRPRDFLYAHDCDRIVIHCDAPTALQVDGEDLGDVETAVFEAERDAVAVLAG